MGSPTTRSLAFHRKNGHTAAVVEKSIPWPRPRGTKIDLFGFGDVLSFDLDAVTITQTTSTPNVHSRIQKTIANPLATKWLDGQRRRIEVHGWAKRGPRGKRKLWTLTRYMLSLHGGHLRVEEHP
jgi:hypothetical protein